MSVGSERRKPRLHISLRADILQALQRVAEDYGMSVSEVIEILLGYRLELGSIMEEAHSLLEMHRDFRRRESE